MNAPNAPDELRAIGERLLILAETDPTRAGAHTMPTLLSPEDATDDRYLASAAKSLYAARRLRDRHLHGELFGEPAWDMLLDLFIRGVDGKRTSVTSLAVASGVPPTTALRWIGTLQDAGLVVREEAEHDRRVAYLALSAAGYQSIRRFLVDAVRLVRPVRNFFLLDEKLGA